MIEEAPDIAHLRLCPHAQIPTPTQAHTLRPIHAHTPTSVYAHTPMPTHAHIPTSISTHTYTYAYTHTYTYTCLYARIHLHLCPHARTYTWHPYPGSLNLSEPQTRLLCSRAPPTKHEDSQRRTDLPLSRSRGQERSRSSRQEGSCTNWSLGNSP